MLTIAILATTCILCFAGVFALSLSNKEKDRKWIPLVALTAILSLMMAFHLHTSAQNAVIAEALGISSEEFKKRVQKKL